MKRDHRKIKIIKKSITKSEIDFSLYSNRKKNQFRKNIKRTGSNWWHSLIPWGIKITTEKHERIFVTRWQKFESSSSNNLLKNKVYGMHIFRSSDQRFSVSKGVLRSFTKFTRNHLYQSLFFLIKLQASGLSLKKRPW